MSFITQGKTNWKFLLIVFIIAAIVVGISWWLFKSIFIEGPLIKSPKQNEKYCEKDEDCACGIHKTKKGCFYGNKNYVDTTEQCPDFCTGIGGNFRIKCVNNECKQISIQDETADWKTYRNQEYGFEIKYPKDFSLQEIIPSESIQFNSPLHFQIGWTTVDYLQGRKITNQECLFGQESSDKNLLSPKGVITINGINFNYYTNYPKYIDAYCGMSGGCSQQDVYRTYYEGYCHQIILYSTNKQENETASQTFNQMLSTFKFLE